MHDLIKQHLYAFVLMSAKGPVKTLLDILKASRSVTTTKGTFVACFMPNSKTRQTMHAYKHLNSTSSYCLRIIKESFCYAVVICGLVYIVYISIKKYCDLWKK